MSPDPKTPAEPASPFAPANGQVVLERHEDDYSLQLVISSDERRCLASIVPTRAASDLLDEQRLLHYLEQGGICDGVRLEAIRDFCQKACKGENLRQVVLAATEAPQKGKDGWLELKVRLAGSANEGGFVENEKGQVDLYTLNLFTCVEPGQEIALLHPPEEGVSSFTVTGKLLPAEPGAEAEVRLGSGLHRDGDRFVADLAGRVEWSEQVLAVSEDYVIHGDVDLSVGNIRFPGNVFVRGDVLDDFDIRCGKNLTVVGNVGACHLIIDGDVSLGSMAGKNEGLVKCGGTLKARYLNSVYIECLGDVVVDNEIRNSVVKSGGAVLLPGGQISGGETVALKGIEAKIIGATAGVPTRLCAGVYFPENDRLAFLKSQQKSLTLQRKFIHHCLGPLEKQVSQAGETPGALEKRLQILRERLVLIDKMEADIKRELSQFTFGEHPGNAKINIQRLIKEQVRIQLGTVSDELRFEQYGPLSIIADPVRGLLSFNEYSPLTINADDMEPQEPAADPNADDNLQHGSRTP